MSRIPYTLRDRELFRRIMEHPGRGVPHTIRSLAETVGCSSATVGHLLSGEQVTARMEHAHAIAESLGVAVLVLFVPPTSPNLDTPSRLTDAQQEDHPQ